MSGMGSLFQYNFMVFAFVAILIITPLFGILGTMVVSNRMAFFSDALGHSALTGIAVGVICGLGEPSLAMVLFGVAFALLLNWIRSRNISQTDTVISVFSSCCIAIGLAILSRGGNFSQYSSLLLGDVLSITKQQIIYLVLLFAATIVFWIVCYNRLQAIVLNRTLAKSRQIRILLVENLFSIFIALVVMLSVEWIGILLINALLILPAASARNISGNVREYHLFAIIFSMFSGIVGLFISYYTDIATGPMIVIIAAVIFFASYFYGRKRCS
ncbi:MAG: metal ABC transporter permease [Lachnospiraceae bacterium]|nr:metal ABC transporter permease [Lachnospiraceae bacterium]